MLNRLQDVDLLYGFCDSNQLSFLGFGDAKRTARLSGSCFLSVAPFINAFRRLVFQRTGWMASAGRRRACQRGGGVVPLWSHSTRNTLTNIQIELR